MAAEFEDALLRMQRHKDDGLPCHGQLGIEELAKIACLYLPSNRPDGSKGIWHEWCLKASGRIKDDKWYRENFPDTGPLRRRYNQNDPMFVAYFVLMKAQNNLPWITDTGYILQLLNTVRLSGLYDVYPDNC